jgi:hypothetical protein
MHLEKKGEYAVILEQEWMSLAPDRGGAERVKELVGKGTMQALGLWRRLMVVEPHLVEANSDRGIIEICRVA